MRRVSNEWLITPPPEAAVGYAKTGLNEIIPRQLKRLRLVTNAIWTFLLIEFAAPLKLNNFALTTKREFFSSSYYNYEIKLSSLRIAESLEAVRIVLF